VEVQRICTMLSLFSLLAVLPLSACAAPASPGDGQPSTPAATNAVAPKPRVSSTLGPVSTKGLAQTKSSGSRIDACAIFTLQDAEEFLGAKAKITSRLEPGSSKSYETRCSYRTETAPDRGFGLFNAGGREARQRRDRLRYTGFDGDQENLAHS